jgi:hypothetical protein
VACIASVDDGIETNQTALHGTESSGQLAIACLDDGHGPEDLLNMGLEVTDENKKAKAAKVTTARPLWVSAMAVSSAWRSSNSPTRGTRSHGFDSFVASLTRNNVAQG